MMFSEMVGKFTSIYWKIGLGVVCMDYINPDNEISAWVERYLNLKRYVEIMEHVWKCYSRYDCCRDRRETD